MSHDFFKYIQNNIEYLIQNMIHQVIQILHSMSRFGTATYLSLLFKFVLSDRFSNSLWESDVLLFSEFINVVSILFYNFIELIISLYTFLVISFSRYKECIICLISFSKFSDELPAFTCARAINNFWSISSGLDSFSPSTYFSLFLALDAIKEYSLNNLITACRDS